jgi:hypothetical protein
VDPVPDSILLRKSGSAGNRIQASGSVVRNSEAVEHNNSLLHTKTCIVFQRNGFKQLILVSSGGLK